MMFGLKIAYNKLSLFELDTLVVLASAFHIEPHVVSLKVSRKQLAQLART